MPLFAYTALDSAGAKRTGVQEAQDAQAAASALRGQDMHVVDVRPQRGRGAVGKFLREQAAASDFRRFVAFVTRRDIIHFFRQTALMLRSGLTVVQATDFFQEHCRKPRLKKAVERITERVLGGESLSSALRAESGMFRAMAVKMVETGEVTGKLDVMLDRVATQMEREIEIRNTLLASLVYPALVMLGTMAVSLFLILIVIPKLQTLLEARNVELPASTQLLISIADFFKAAGVWIILGLLGAVAAVIVVRLTEKGRYAADRAILAIPVVGHLITLAFAARFGRTLAILHESGVQVLDALRILGESTSNRAFARQLQRAEDEVLGGKSISSGLRSRVVPQLVAVLVNTGEITGTLDNVLEEIGEFYEKKMQRLIKWMTTMFEPVMILIVGAIVGFVYISFFQAVYQIGGH